MKQWANRVAHPGLPEGHPGRNVEFARSMWRRELERLGSADLYFVSLEMAQLAAEAAKSIPSFQVHADDLPSRNGLIFYQGGLQGGMVHHDGTAEDTQAVLWTSNDAGLYVTGYLHRDVLVGRARDDKQFQAVQRLLNGPRLYVNPSASFSAPFGHNGWVDPPENRSVWHILPQLITTWLLMQQPLASITEAHLDRAARRRLARAHSEPAPIRVIHLRRPASTTATTGPSDREYHHQWIVRGHWRQQWYPSREVHRPVWIAPHIKGPEGAPLIGGEKVYAWTK